MTGLSSSVEFAAAWWAAEAIKTAEACGDDQEKRWVLLSMLAEVHRRAALKIENAAQSCRPCPEGPPS